MGGKEMIKIDFKHNSGKIKCPECGNGLKVLLFLGVEPDGFVCEICRVWFDDTLKALAKTP
jgi:hypothetical protein